MERANPFPRLDRLRATMSASRVDLVAVAPGPDLRWLAPDLRLLAIDRPCVLFVTADAMALVIIHFEAAPVAAVAPALPLFEWTDREGPAKAFAAAIAHLGLTGASRVAVAADMPFRYLAAFRSHLPADLIDARVVFNPLRLLKSAEEIERLEVAARLMEGAVDHATAIAHPGMTERELEGEIAAFLRRGGASTGEAMVVASGAHAADPHHFADGTPLRVGEAVLFDIAAPVDGYWSDVTQQVHFGTPSPAYRRAYEAVREAQEAGVQAVRVGARIGDINDAANVVLEAHGFTPNGRTGHGIGLDVHEDPSLVPTDDAVIEPGLVVTIEPGVYIPGEFGIRIEDVVVAEDGGPRRLTGMNRTLYCADA